MPAFFVSNFHHDDDQLTLGLRLMRTVQQGYSAMCCFTLGFQLGCKRRIAWLFHCNRIHLPECSGLQIYASP